MVSVKKGDKYYYIYNIKGDLVWAKLIATRDFESQHGIGSGFKVLESNDKFINNTVLSANQLHGVGIWGFNPFISKDNYINIKRIFEGNKV